MEVIRTGWLSMLLWREKKIPSMLKHDKSKGSEHNYVNFLPKED